MELLSVEIARGVQFLGQYLQLMEGGNLRVYCLYILAALGVVLMMVEG